jgi:hypothetical protein
LPCDARSVHGSTRCTCATCKRLDQPRQAMRLFQADVLACACPAMRDLSTVVHAVQRASGWTNLARQNYLRLRPPSRRTTYQAKQPTRRHYLPGETACQAKLPTRGNYLLLRRRRRPQRRSGAGTRPRVVLKRRHGELEPADIGASEAAATYQAKLPTRRGTRSGSVLPCSIGSHRRPTSDRLSLDGALAKRKMPRIFDAGCFGPA